MIPQYRIEQYLDAIRGAWLGESPLPAHPDEPVWRIEKFLAAILSAVKGDSPVVVCPDPVWRLEEFGRAIYDAITSASPAWPCPTPASSLEVFLHAIYAMVADGTEEGTPTPSWDIESWLVDVYNAAKEGSGEEKTVSGVLIHITDALAKAALAVEVAITPIQDLHGYSSPWPAGGGKNIGILSVATEDSQQNASKSYVNNGVVVTSTGSYGRVAYIIPVSTGTTYTISYKAKRVGAVQSLQFGDSVVWGSPSYGSQAITETLAAYTKTFTATSNTLFVGVYPNIEGHSITIEDFQVEVGSDATTFAPYSNICPITGRTGLSVYVSPTQDPDDATVYNVDLTTQAGTVYGGTVDVVTGVLTVTNQFATLTPSSKYTDENGYFWYTGASALSLPSISGLNAGLISNRMIANGNTTTDDKDGKMTFYANGIIRWKEQGSLSKDDYNTYLSSNPLQICYELATPLTYQLTPQEVQMLLGENYVWSSSGDSLSVTYMADGNATPLQALNIMLGSRYVNPGTAEDVSDAEALDILLGR